MPGNLCGGSTWHGVRLEQLPAVGRPRKPAKPPAPVTSTAGDEHLEELPPASEAEATRWSDSRVALAESRAPVGIDVHPMRELLDLAASDQPAVAEEDGLYRIQPHAYGGVPGRNPGLRRLAAAVIGGTAEADGPAGDVVAVGSDDADKLPVSECGIELDAFTVDASGDRQTGTRGGSLDRLDRLGRRADAVGAALLVRGQSGGLQPRQVTGLLREQAVRLAFADEDPVAARYLTRRVVLIAEDPLRTIPGLDHCFPTSVRDRIGCLAFLPSRVGGELGYLLLVGVNDADAWDLPALVRRLGMVRAAGTGDRPPP